MVISDCCLPPHCLELEMHLESCTRLVLQLFDLVANWFGVALFSIRDTCCFSLFNTFFYAQKVTTNALSHHANKLNICEPADIEPFQFHWVLFPFSGNVS